MNCNFCNFLSKRENVIFYFFFLILKRTFHLEIKIIERNEIKTRDSNNKYFSTVFHIIFHFDMSIEIKTRKKFALISAKNFLFMNTFNYLRNENRNY